jgi:hypothetical protein
MTMFQTRHIPAASAGRVFLDRLRAAVSELRLAMVRPKQLSGHLLADIGEEPAECPDAARDALAADMLRRAY